MKKAIIIFVRNPELGKVKTRLARQIGDELTLQVYSELLMHTRDTTCNLDCDRFVFYSENIVDSDIWDADRFEKKLQEGDNLGDRMMLAFFELFQQGYSKVVIIGSDCPELTSFVIDDAFDKLDSHDVVIGPSTDGGYYLLGLTHLLPDLFKDKEWSTEKVLAETIKDVVRLKRSSYFLTELSDIDTAEDLHRFQQLLK
ncbi:glycosyltransferase [Chitinophagaceae bacterium IBVUCB2]|nr:glycosyltransferase [Chitinophagaceae bacterium IBVUCB2]